MQRLAVAVLQNGRAVIFGLRACLGMGPGTLVPELWSTTTRQKIVPTHQAFKPTETIGGRANAGPAASFERSARPITTDEINASTSIPSAQPASESGEHQNHYRVQVPSCMAFLQPTGAQRSGTACIIACPNVSLGQAG